MQKNTRPRAREVGVRVGVLETGAENAITDVAGVRVGHTTIIRGESVRTGVTAILPHAGNLFRERVAGAVFVGNGFGKLAGSTQVNELGEIETPILLTSTLSVAVGFAAVWGGAMLARRFKAPATTGRAQYEMFERHADARDPAQSAGAERDIRDSTIEPPVDV